MKRLYLCLDTDQEIIYYIGFEGAAAMRAVIRLYAEKTRIGVRMEDQELPIALYGYDQGEKVLDQYLEGILLPPDRIIPLHQVFELIGYCMENG